MILEKIHWDQYPIWIIVMHSNYLTRKKFNITVYYVKNKSEKITFKEELTYVNKFAMLEFGFHSNLNIFRLSPYNIFSGKLDQKVAEKYHLRLYSEFFLHAFHMNFSFISYLLYLFCIIPQSFKFLFANFTWSYILDENFFSHTTENKIINDLMRSKCKSSYLQNMV